MSSAEQVKQQFDSYIGAVPASRLDLDELAGQARTVRRRRRFAGLAGVAAGVVVAILASAAVVGDRVATPPVQPIASRPATPVATPSPSGPEATAHRLLAALTAAIQARATDVTGVETLRQYLPRCTGPGMVAWVPADPGVVAEPCVEHGVLVPDPAKHFLWKGQLTSAAGTYPVVIHIYRATYYDPSAPPADANDAAERRTAAEQGNAPERGPDGSNILAADDFLNMVKPDGTGISIKVVSDPVGSGPLSRADVVGIGLWPDLHF